MTKANWCYCFSILSIGIFVSFGAIANGSENDPVQLLKQPAAIINPIDLAPPTKAILASRKNLRKATGVLRIQQGMSYQKARKILIQQGWQPNISVSNEELRLDGQVRSTYNSGYKEIKACSGTGLGLCRFEFINSKGELLVVSATSQVELTVFHWFLDPPPKDIPVSRRKLPKDTGVIGIQQGMPYEKAQKIFIQQGWQPNVPISNGEIPSLENSDSIAISIYDRGYVEVKNCSETGSRLCRFEFTNYKSELLVVSTTSQPELKVIHWSIQKSEYGSTYR
jgi:hypothetical protein